MAHGTATNSIELSGDTKAFDRVARKWNVDYAFYKTGSDKYLLFFKAGQADAMTACFSEYSRKVLGKAKIEPCSHPGTTETGGRSAFQRKAEAERTCKGGGP